MQVRVSSRHGDLGSETQQIVEQKASKLLKFFDRITSINVTVDLEQMEKPKVEIRVSVEEADDFVATDHGNNVVTGIESVVHKLEQQLKKHKEKTTNHRNAALKHAEVPQDDE